MVGNGGGGVEGGGGGGLEEDLDLPLCNDPGKGGGGVEGEGGGGGLDDDRAFDGIESDFGKGGGGVEGGGGLDKDRSDRDRKFSDNFPALISDKTCSTSASVNLEKSAL